MPDGHPSEYHPIDDDVFQTVYDYLAEPADADSYHEALRRIDEHLEDGTLYNILNVADPDQDPSLELVDSDSTGYAFVTYRPGFWDELLDEAGIDDAQARRLIRDAHTRQIAELNPDLEGPPDDIEWLDADSWEGILVAMSPAWIDAEAAIQERFRFLVQAGCTPAQALDYWMTEHRGCKQTLWAHWRGVDQSTVSENVSKARDAIDSVEYGVPEETPEQQQIREDVYETMERERTIEIDDDGNAVHLDDPED